MKTHNQCEGKAPHTSNLGTIWGQIHGPVILTYGTGARWTVSVILKTKTNVLYNTDSHLYDLLGLYWAQIH